MSAYLLVAEYLFEHGSITVIEASEHIGLDAVGFRRAMTDLRRVIKIKSEKIPAPSNGRIMHKHTLVREPRCCISQ